MPPTDPDSLSSGVPGGATIRQQLVDLLAERMCSIRDISQELGIPEKDVGEHLQHVARTVAREGRKLVTVPCECLACGYVFESRKRFTRASRCPECKAERITGPFFEVQ